jgi:hypothetical protein
MRYTVESLNVQHTAEQRPTVHDRRLRQTLSPRLIRHDQDMPSVIAPAQEDWQTWLRGATDAVHSLVRLTAVKEFTAGPES